MAARARARSMIEADAPAATAPPTEGASASEIAEVSRCLVYCRMRPSFTRDFEDGGHELLTLQDRKVIVKDERTYEFDGTFKGDSRQDDVFRIVALPCIQHAFKGFCSALMCYGQTGTGKSFTMCCTKPGQEGIIPQAAITMFSMIRRDAARKYTVTAEFIQIYRDQLGDLMTEGGKDRVDIHFDATTGVTLPGCTSHELTSPEDFMSFYHEGDKRRVVTATAMNPESSRGHTALVVRINSIPVDDECGSRISGKITFIDLAGYERFSKTGISNSNAIMKDEAKTINASLLSLGHVVTSLSNGDKHIPWRNSKLTRLLQDSIGGRSRTTVILTVGPSSEHLHETTNTLQFGMRAMAVKVQAKVSTTVDFEKLAARLQAMLDEKNARISDLEIQAAANDAERQELLDRHRRDTEALHEAHAAELEAAKARGATADQLLEMSKQLNLEATTLKEQQEEEISYREDQHQKDMMEVFAEEQKRAQRDLVREKMARETAIVELEKRLEEARGGGNADLEHALRELAERDTKLVERATKIAALSARCEQLAQAVRNLGGEPSYDESDDDEPSALFVDISQVEDMKKRFGTEKDALSNQVADLRAALDETAAALAARTKEVDALQEAAIAREASFADLGAPKTPPPAVVEVKQVGLSEVEVAAIKTSMQSDIDFWKHRAVTLQAEVEEEKKKVAQHVAKAAQPKPDPTGQSRTIKELTMKLERLTSENEALKLTATENGSADPDKSVLALLAMKDDQLEHALQTMVDKERRIQDLQKQLQHAHKQNRSKLEGEASLADSFAGPVTNHSFSATMTNSEIVTQSTSGVNLDEFSAMLKAQRVKNTELQTKLMSDVPLDEKMKQLLASRDEQLAERDAEILRRGAMIESLQSALVRLERQLEEHGMVPTCKVDAETRALVDEKLNSQLKQLEQRQKELEDDNAKKAADKQKAAQLLQELNDARLKDAARFAQQEAELQRIKIEQAAKEQREAAELQRRRQELADAQELREQLQENTRQMMEAQARLALEREEAQSGGLFSRLKKRFAN